MVKRVENPGRRSIRSFIIRGGRLTKGQQSACDRLFPVFGREISEFEGSNFISQNDFGRSGELNIEIGFGDGEALKTMAMQHPDQNFVGIEVHPPGVGHLLIQLEKHQIENVRIFQDDAIDVLTSAIGKETVDKTMLFFPDPWPKKKHHKRRILQPEFLSLILDTLKPDGVFHFATDWKEYAFQAMDLLQGISEFENIAGVGRFSPRPDYRPETKFERRGLRLGHSVYDIVMKKVR